MPLAEIQERETRWRKTYYNYNYNNRSRRPGIGAAQGIKLAVAGDDALGGAADIALGIGVEARDGFEAAVHLEGRSRHRAEILRRVGVHDELMEVEVLAREDLLDPRGGQLADMPFGQP